MSVFLSLSVCMYVCLCLSMSVCLSVCLSVWVRRVPSISISGCMGPSDPVARPISDQGTADCLPLWARSAGCPAVAAASGIHGRAPPSDPASLDSDPPTPDPRPTAVLLCILPYPALYPALPLVMSGGEPARRGRYSSAHDIGKVSRRF